MKLKLTATILTVFLMFFNASAQKTFTDNEKLTYEAYYAFVTGAKIILETKPATLLGKDYINIKVYGYTTGLVDKIYKIKEEYQTWVDPSNNYLPAKAFENVHEGSSYSRYISLQFNHDNNTVVSSKSGSHSVPANCYDILGAAYKLRTIDMTKLTPGQTIRIETFFGEEPWPLVVAYKKTEVIKVGKIGKVKCYEFVPVVEVSGTFSSKDALHIWISADENKIPIRAQMDLMVGACKVDLIKYENLANDFSSKQ